MNAAWSLHMNSGSPRLVLHESRSVPVRDVGSLQHSQGRQHLAQQVPDEVLTLGPPPEGPPPGAGLHDSHILHRHKIGNLRGGGPEVYAQGVVEPHSLAICIC